jgi:hypothetical protein
MEAEPPKADQPKRKRRWCQFSLRALLLVVTAVGVWLRWGSHIVRERKAALEEIKRSRGRSLSPGDVRQSYADSPFNLPLPKEASATIPFYREMFGNEPVAFIYLADDAPPGEEERIAVVFPEAAVNRMRREASVHEPAMEPSNSRFGIPDPTLLKYEPLPSGGGK